LSKTRPKVTLEFAANVQGRDTFHDSPSDEVPHAGVVYEDKDGNHLSKKHIAQKAGDQIKV